MLRTLLLLTAATLTLAAQTPAPEPSKEAKPVTSAPAATPAPAPAPAQAAPAPKPAAAPAPKPESLPVAAPAKPAEDKVIAKVGSELIRESDFELFLSVSMNDQQRMQMQFVPGARATYLKRFLEFKLLAAKAHKEGMEKQPGYAKKKAMMDMNLLIQTLMERDGPALQAKLVLKDEEVKAYFTAHPDKFTTPGMFSARHILVGTRSQTPNDKALTDDEAKAKAAKILDELKAGKTFDVAAKEYSDDPGSKDKGGLYEDTPFGRFVPEFEAAVNAQKVGEIGAPVKSTFGYHIIKVEKVTPAAPQTFETAKEAAKQQATAERQEAVMKEYIDGVKKEIPFAEGEAASKGAVSKEPAAKPAPKSKKVAK